MELNFASGKAIVWAVARHGILFAIGTRTNLEMDAFRNNRVSDHLGRDGRPLVIATAIVFRIVETEDVQIVRQLHGHRNRQRQFDGRIEVQPQRTKLIAFEIQCQRTAVAFDFAERLFNTVEFDNIGNAVCPGQFNSFHAAPI